MALWHDLDRMASLCKHSDEMLPTDEVRALCRRAQSVVSLVSGAESVFVRQVHGEWLVTLSTSVPM